MSGRQSGSRNTLFNYFNKLPSDTNGKIRENDEDNLNKECLIVTKEKRQLNTSNDEDDENIQPMKRRKRIIQESDSSDDDINSSTNNVMSKFMTPKKSKPQKKIENSTPSKIQLTPSKQKSQKKSEVSTSSRIQSTPSKQTKLDTKMKENTTKEGSTWFHNTLDFLKPEKIRDKNSKRLTDPDYDPRTLYVPPDFLSKQTPAMQQWWILKRDHFDCVLFFKVGKFYELYHMDAVIGVNELGFSFMKGEFAHSGFPESAYGRMMSSLVELGYKVARVEQTETPETMAKRLKNTPRGGSKQNKVVSREICQITNKGTQVQGSQDMPIKHALSTHLLAIYENRSNNFLEFGVCFVDTSIGTFYLGQFEDNNRYSRLLTVLAQYPPVVILEQRKQLSNETKNILKSMTDCSTFESLSAESQFLSSTKTLTQLQENGYFNKNDDDNIKLPFILQQMISKDDVLNTSCKIEYELAIRCLGACMWYLKDCLLDIQLLSLGQFERYIPPDMDTSLGVKACKFMILDATTMSSLDILGRGQTLEGTLDNCNTAMGKRLLHQWVCKPLCNPEEIYFRQEIICELMKSPELTDTLKKLMKSLPDLERLISKIHCLGNAMRAKNHPDSRAILYEEKMYSKRKIKAFVQAIQGFEKAVMIAQELHDIESEKLFRYAGFADRELFAEVNDTLSLFQQFTTEEVEKEGKLIPKKEFDDEYDNTMQEIEGINEELDDYLKSQQNYFGCAVSYFGSDKKRFQLDVPEHATHKANKNYFLEGTKKGSKPSKRYTTNESKALLAKMIEAETKSTEVLRDINRRIFEKFSEKYDKLSSVCHSMAILDVFMSLAEYTNNQSIRMCAPKIEKFYETPILIIKDGVHPFIPNKESFVPNDTELGTEDHPRTLILTGPNMGGKSTLMRQVALLTIMAQIGCYVPATEMKLSVVDRIFTRLGAHDDIMTGNSTFLVELKEASAILQHSTIHSLVFLDELGRGTATYDGTAIATAYVDRLTRINCRTIFSTHYFNLLDFFKNNESIQLGHMGCRVMCDGNKKTVMFMYKMLAGRCPKSYGFNAARLAGIPQSILTRAEFISDRLLKETVFRKLFRQMFQTQ